MNNEKMIDYISPIKDTESLKQECYGYLKTKQFMADRIFEQQKEIETLKNQVFFHSIKHIQMYDWLKFMNQQVKLISANKIEKNDLNISKNELENSFIFENAEDLEKIPSSPLKILKKDSYKTILLQNDQLNKINNLLKNENLELKMQNEKLKLENLEKDLLISKIKSDKFLILNELNELVNSLKTIDLKILNQFYKKINKNSILTRRDMPNSLGIKYNIISAQNQLALLIHSDIIASKSFNYAYNKLNDSLLEEKNKLMNDSSKSDKDDYNKEFLDLDKYLSVLSKFEKDFQTNFENNIKNYKEEIQF